MKAIKIILALAVVSAIGYFADSEFSGGGGGGCIGDDCIPPDSIIHIIDGKINEIRQLPVNTFVSGITLYSNCNFIITHNEKKLGSTMVKNKKRDLNDAYGKKIKDQALDVFNNTVWDLKDLDTIKVQTNNLKKVIGVGNTLYQDFEKILQVIKRHDEINSFIGVCRIFPIKPTYEMSENPLIDAGKRINQSSDYLIEASKHEYLKYCTRLHDGLKRVPRVIYDNYVIYLYKKIDEHGSKYPDYPHQPTWLKEISIPLADNLQLLQDTEIFKNTATPLELENKYKSLLTKLEEYNKKRDEYHDKNPGKEPDKEPDNHIPQTI